MANKSYGEYLREQQNSGILKHKHMMSPSAHVSESDSPLERGVVMFRTKDKTIKKWLRESDRRVISMNTTIRPVTLREVAVEARENSHMAAK